MTFADSASPVFQRHRTPKNPFRAIGGFLVRLSESNSKVRQLQELQDLDDAALPRRGLKRDELVLHVFQGSL